MTKQDGQLASAPMMDPSKNPELTNGENETDPATQTQQDAEPPSSGAAGPQQPGNGGEAPGK